MNTHNAHAIFPQAWNRDHMIHGDGTCIICGQDLDDQVYQGPRCRICFLNKVDNNWTDDLEEQNSKFQEDWYGEPYDDQGESNRRIQEDCPEGYTRVESVCVRNKEAI